MKEKLLDFDILRNMEISDMKKKILQLMDDNKKLIAEKELVLSNFSRDRENISRVDSRAAAILEQEKGLLDVKLVSVPQDSALGQVKGADSIFEIYTESYGEHPVVIQGAGAGAEVTARGVFGDILKLSERNYL